MKKGFTLLELLISITIFAIISGAVYTSLYLGIKVWKHEEANDSALQEIMLTFDAIEESLQSTFMNPDNENIKFKGSSDKIEFFAVDKTEKLESVSFYPEASSDKAVVSLYVLKQKYSKTDTKQKAVPELVNSRISSFKLSYFNKKENKWRDEWTSESTVPSQVKVEIDINNGTARDAVHLEKYISIPIANEIEYPAAEVNG